MIDTPERPGNKKLELVFAKYDKPDRSVYYLLLVIGDGADDIIALQSDNITSRDANKIRSMVGILNRMNLKERISAIRDAIPKSYNNAIRKFKKSKFRVQRRFDVKSLT